MMLKRLFFFFTTFLLFLFVSIKTIAQQPASPLTVGDTTGKRLDVINASRYNFQQIDSSGDFVSLAGNVKIRQGRTLFYCDSAVLDQKRNTVEAFGNIHINDDDSIHTYSQYLKYYGQEKDAILKNRVRLTDGKGVLTTNELHYNTFTKIGTYVNGGKVVTGTTTLTSTEGIYYGETRDVNFKKKVVMVDPDFRLTTDTLLYNTFTEIARFTVPTVIKTPQRTITTSQGYYDMQHKNAVLGKRPFVDDKDYTLVADDIAIDEQSGFGDALGSAIYTTKDTANPSTIMANRLQSNNKTGAMLATQKPVMIIRQGVDSILIAADTLYSARLSDLRKTRFVPDISNAGIPQAVDTTKASQPDSSAPALNANSKLAGRRGAARGLSSIAPPARVENRDTTATRPTPADSLLAAGSKTSVKAGGDISRRLTVDSSMAKKEPVDSSRNRFVEAYYNVRIFSDSMQAVGDSLFYSLEDSTFRLFKDPIVWSQDNQITGDTIYMFTNNKKPKRMYVFENALVINKVDQFYNQVKGNVINSYFVDGNIDLVKAKGSAENIYYAVDDAGKYIGVNRSTCDVIDMYFADKHPKKIVFRNNLQGTTSPMGQVKHNEMRLRGFKWLDDRRPKSKAELFGK